MIAFWLIMGVAHLLYAVIALANGNGTSVHIFSATAIVCFAAASIISEIRRG